MNSTRLKFEFLFCRELPSHPNVVQMYGASLDGPQAVIVLEYCEGGITHQDQFLFSLVTSIIFEIGMLILSRKFGQIIV
jgi:serine/threonine protein kinase